LRENKFDKATLKELTQIAVDIFGFCLEAFEGFMKEDADKYDNAMSNVATATSRAGKIRGY